MGINWALTRIIYNNRIHKKGTDNMLTTQERIALIEYAALTLADDLNRALGLPYRDSTMAAHNQWRYFLTMPTNESLDN